MQKTKYKFDSQTSNLAILNSEDMKVYLYDAKFLQKNFYSMDWKEEFYSEVEGIESFITNVLGFKLGNIQWQEFKNTPVINALK